MTPLVRAIFTKVVGRRPSRSLRAVLNPSDPDLPVTCIEPGKSTVVVLAPHMDDEVLGCGGTIARHANAGSDITVVFLTDGSRAGDVDVRKAEAHNAAGMLGVRTLNFLDAADSGLDADDLVAGRLRKILESIQPEIVYLPFFLERHPDHRAANKVLLDATLDTSLRFECRGYEVWTPLWANSVVTIDSTLDIKRKALACYPSQLAQMDYLHGCLGLNAYRAMSHGTRAGRYAEAFHASDLGEYLRLYRATERPG